MNILMHYDTFDLIRADPAEFARKVETAAAARSWSHPAGTTGSTAEPAGAGPGGSVGKRRLRRRARREPLCNPAPGNPTHVDARAQERALERRPSVDPAEAGDLAHSVETRNHLARYVQHAAVEIHVDPAHALARDGKELGRVEGRRIDRLY